MTGTRAKYQRQLARCYQARSLPVPAAIH
ncbi:hypothetical protein ACLK2H_23610 [Escherichia coli]